MWRKKKHNHFRPFIGKQDFTTALLQHVMAGDKRKIFQEKQKVIIFNVFVKFLPKNRTNGMFPLPQGTSIFFS